jgi:serine/threonine protein kinase
MTPSAALAEARERIANARGRNLPWLDLGDLGLEHIPQEIGELLDLRVLALGKVKFREAPGKFEWEWNDTRPEPQLTSVEPLRGLSGLTSLALSGCEQLTSVEPLRGLSGLTSLDLSGCRQLTSEHLEPLRGLSGLTSLALSGCEQLTSVEPLRGLSGLTSLDLSWCEQLKEFAPIRPLLDHLTDLKLHDCSLADLDPALCGGFDENVCAKVRAHFADAEFEAVDHTEFKLFLLGNGGVGKTQLRRRLCGQDFKPSISSTHGVEVERFSLTLPTNHTVHLTIWDFGGQDVYHGTHALFLQKHALYVILWHPEMETGTVEDRGLLLRHRPLGYWLDFVRSVAGTDAPVLIVQSQFDDSTAIPAALEVDLSDFKRHPELQASAKADDGLDRLIPELQRSVRYLLKQRPTQKIGAGRVRVRDQLLEWRSREQRRSLAWPEFVELCQAGQGDVSSPEALADFLHHTGFLFYDPGLFHGELILDQGWALEAIYAVFHREKSLRQLRWQGGRFTRENLGDWMWDRDGHSTADQERFIKMMLGCGICFRTRKLSGEREYPEVWEYAAPDHLPTLAAYQQRNPNHPLPDPTTAPVAASISFRFLHDGLLRTLLARIGTVAGNAPEYWMYGCYFRVQNPDTQLRFDSTTSPEGPSAAGTITFSAWGEQGRELIATLLAEVERLSPGQPVQPVWSSQAVADATPRPAGRHPRQAGRPATLDSRTQEARLAELLARALEYSGQGREVPAADLCADCPGLIAELEQLLGLDAALERVADGQGGPRQRASSEPPRPAIPGFEILECLGQGGMGVVWKARDRGLGHTVALKVLREGVVDAELRRRLQQEARALARLRHPHIVQFQHLGAWRSAEGTEFPYLVLEYINGEPLHRHLGLRLVRPVEAAQLVLLLAQAVQHAHQQGVLHRDLKPGNVLLGPPSDKPALNCAWGLPRLTDFGIARLVESGGRLTGPGALLGTLEYMAPEQADGQHVDDERIDVYGLGGILYWLLTGKHPIQGRSPGETLERVRTTPPRPPRELRHEVPAALSALCLDCLQKELARRPTVDTLIKELERHLSPPPAEPRRSPRPGGGPFPGEEEDRMSSARGLEGLVIEDRRVFISYAWGERDEGGLEQDTFVDRVCQAVESWGFDLIRDRQRMRPGESIRQFMEKGARAPRVLLLLNRKYLESEYCIFELDEVHRCSYQGRDFCQRIIPATLPGADLFTIKDRATAALYWKQRVAELAPLEPHMSDADRALFRRMESWARGLSDILTEIANMLHPIGHAAIEANGFQMLRQMLERGRTLDGRE